jgi:hypothetical protein
VAAFVIKEHVFFETGSHYVVQAGLELKILLLCFLIAEIIGMYYHSQQET